MRGMAAAANDLNAFLDALMVDEDLLPEQVVLFGFSQGTMLALHVVPRREDEIAGLVAFSGRLLEPDALIDEVICKPPVLLVHGDQDDVVPVQSLPSAVEGLQQAGFKDVFAGTEAVTRVVIDSEDENGVRWSTVGVSPNIVDASFEALLDAINWKLVRDTN